MGWEQSGARTQKKVACKAEKKMESKQKGSCHWQDGEELCRMSEQKRLRTFKGTCNLKGTNGMGPMLLIPGH